MRRRRLNSCPVSLGHIGTYCIKQVHLQKDKQVIAQVTDKVKLQIKKLIKKSFIANTTRI